MNEPTVTRAGDSIAWTETLPEYPASAAWVLNYRLLWPTGTAVDIATSAAGDDHAVSLTAANTANWLAGTTTLVKWVKKGADRITLGQQSLTVLPDLTVAAVFDGRTPNQKALASAKAALEAYLANGQGHVAEYDIAGRKMRFRDTDQILQLIAHYEREVNREAAALAILNGGSPPGRIYTRF
jgi:hypothetical protein